MTMWAVIMWEHACPSYVCGPVCRGSPPTLDVCSMSVARAKRDVLCPRPTEDEKRAAIAKIQRVWGPVLDELAPNDGPAPVHKRPSA